MKNELNITIREFAKHALNVGQLLEINIECNNKIIFGIQTNPVVISQETILNEKVFVEAVVLSKDADSSACVAYQYNFESDKFEESDKNTHEYLIKKYKDLNFLIWDWYDQSEYMYDSYAIDDTGITHTNHGPIDKIPGTSGEVDEIKAIVANTGDKMVVSVFYNMFYRKEANQSVCRIYQTELNRRYKEAEQQHNEAKRKLDIISETLMSSVYML